MTIRITAKYVETIPVASEGEDERGSSERDDEIEIQLKWNQRGVEISDRD